MSVVSVWRNNLSIGIFLAGRPYGARVEDVLAELGYNPRGQHPANDWDAHLRRLRQAQAAGREKYADRTPGYFTINAQPFGNTFIYRAVWYVWVNPQSHVNQAVLIGDFDLESLRQRREKDLATRAASARSIRAARNVQKERNAIAGGNASDLFQVQAEMGEDDTLAELLTNQLGLPYTEVGPILQQIANGNPFNNFRFNFTRTAQRIVRLQDDLRREHQRISNQLGSWIMLQTGVPNNARLLALQDAQQRVANL